MPSFADSAVIMILALILFGPKRLPELARQLGKLMAEFRRASNEFRTQMEDELRMEEHKEHQRKVKEMAGPEQALPEPEAQVAADHLSPESVSAPEEAPIAQAGELKMMPPSTGLPVESAVWGTTSVAAPEPAPAEAVEETSLGVSSEEPRAEVTPDLNTDAHEQAHA